MHRDCGIMRLTYLIISRKDGILTKTEKTRLMKCFVAIHLRNSKLRFFNRGAATAHSHDSCRTVLSQPQEVGQMTARNSALSTRNSRPSELR